ncbi:MAG: histidinol-phosphatase [Saprospiraceae bacterium]|nr:histidinol-phosphatase [Saprospiraceae bacterium]
MNKLLFLDRDGTLVYEPHDYILDDFSKLEFYKNVIYFLRKIVEETDFKLVMVTNQDGLGTPKFPEEKFQKVQDLILKILANEGIHFYNIHIDRSYPEDNLPTRKPGTGMLTEYIEGNYDLSKSYVIGDRLTDMELAKRLGAKGIWLDQEPALGANEIQVSPLDLDTTIMLQTQSWEAIYKHLTWPI